MHLDKGPVASGLDADFISAWRCHCDFRWKTSLPETSYHAVARTIETPRDGLPASFFAANCEAARLCPPYFIYLALGLAYRLDLLH